MSRIHFVASILATTVACTQTTTSEPPAAQKSTAAASKATKVAAANQATKVAAAASKVAMRDAPLPIGAASVMTDVKMTNVDGKDISIAEVKGAKGTLVVFTCNHCPYAKAWESRISDLGNDAKRMGFGVIAINPNDPTSYPTDGIEQMKVRAEKARFEFPYVVDTTSDVARGFGATKTPEVFLFDTNDKLVYYGAVDDNHRDATKVESQYLKDALTAVAGGQSVAKNVTKALGCSIKYRPQS